MFTMKRLVRAFDGMSTVKLAGKDRGGEQGEDDAELIIRAGGQGCYMRNPILPHPRKPGFFLESDFLVYAHGALFCVEIKNYRGRVYYPTRTHTIYVKKGWFIFKRTVAQTVVDGYDYSKVIQEKSGYNGEGITTREQPNPLTKTQNIVDDLQRFLPRVDTHFQGVPIYPVLGFSEKTDISAIYDFKAGIIHISELPKFFAAHGNGTPSKAQVQRMQQALNLLPTWDRIWTTNNEMFYGTITDRDFTFKDINNRTYTLPYQQIQSIELKRDGAFSAYDDLTVFYSNGKKQAFRCTGGEIHLDRFQGEKQIHRLRNVTRIVAGIANKQF
ncbi:nuclease-related domain-containing protein [Dictyobacter arantiisoli]|uniref:NERD domain-containing protein n=1 Tax=Dictyobacter arantiisoli TaxID=2014874 RepID=A0A5A5TFY4_9CHLR|nr:nuclease-related domain-containing protein [Dictyobacter arantiisoli]GCF10066.1 hypothetical protein KDI_36300 [Dictyobacter arantiisoli]